MGSSVLLVLLIPFLLPRIIKFIITDGPEFAGIFLNDVIEVIKNFDMDQFLSNLQTAFPELIDALNSVWTN